MTREEFKELVVKNISELYGIEGDVRITIEERTTSDRIIMDICKKNKPQEKKMVSMTENHKKKISNSMKGKKLSEKTKERMRQNSQRINVYQYTIDGELVNVWKSTREAARIGGFNNSAISKCCRGKWKSAYGYIWEYKPLGEEDVDISIHVEKTYKKERHIKAL